MTVTFNGPSKLIICDSGVRELSVRELYSAWKNWVYEGNANYLLAFNAVGGEDIDQTEGTKIPPYIFLLNGWKIRPDEANHTLNVIDGILVVDGGGDPFVNTIGNYNVVVNFKQPVQAISFATSGGDSISAEEVWEESILDTNYNAGEILKMLLPLVTGKPYTKREIEDMDIELTEINSIELEPTELSFKRMGTPSFEEELSYAPNTIEGTVDRHCIFKYTILESTDDEPILRDLTTTIDLSDDEEPFEITIPTTSLVSGSYILYFTLSDALGNNESSIQQFEFVKS